MKRLTNGLTVACLAGSMALVANAEVQDDPEFDKPDRLFVESYQEGWTDHSQQWDLINQSQYEFTYQGSWYWADAQGGNGEWITVSTGSGPGWSYNDVCHATQEWPASYWPWVSAGTQVAEGDCGQMDLVSTNYGPLSQRSIAAFTSRILTFPGSSMNTRALRMPG